MDKQKKQELAEMDSRWEFEKTVEVADDIDWEDVRQKFNELQSNQGDLYMVVDKMDTPSLMQKVKIWFDGYHRSINNKVTFHHKQVYDWFSKLAAHYEISVGSAVWKVFNKEDELREELDLGNTVNVDIGSVGDVAPAESKVDKDELQELIEDE